MKKPFTTIAFMKYQQEERFCNEMAVTVRVIVSQYSFDRENLLIRIATIDGYMKRIICTEFQESIL